MLSNDQPRGIAEEACLVMRLLGACGLPRPEALTEGWRVIYTLVQTQQPDAFERVREACRHFRHAVNLLDGYVPSSPREELPPSQSPKPRKRGRSWREEYIIADEFDREDEEEKT